MTGRNEQLFTEGLKILVGGVSSPVRAFKSVGGIPRYMKKGHGAFMEDEQGQQYLDFVGSWGPLILGHTPGVLVETLKDVLEKGTSFGTSTEIEIRLAELINELIPSMEKIRFVNSGTEATMSAIRLARGFTGRKNIVKFDGCYHGHADGLLIKAGSGVTTLGIPDSPGVPEEITRLTIPAQFNNIDHITETFAAHGQTIAAVIIEPVAGNMGVIPPQPGFLETLRQLCDNSGSLLIFDEVMTGFRVALGGAQQLFSVKPDLTCLGKIIGGGLPVGAYGGKEKIMQHLAPEGPVYQAGTLSGNPLAMAAGFVTLNSIKQPDFHGKLERKCRLFEQMLLTEIDNNKWNICLQRVGSMATLFFQKRPVKNYEQALLSNTDLFKKFFHYLLDQGIYFPPSQFEAFFVSAAHSEENLKKTIEIITSFCYKYI